MAAVQRPAQQPAPEPHGLVVTGPRPSVGVAASPGLLVAVVVVVPVVLLVPVAVAGVVMVLGEVLVRLALHPLVGAGSLRAALLAGRRRRVGRAGHHHHHHHRVVRAVAAVWAMALGQVTALCAPRPCPWPLEGLAHPRCG